MKQTNLAISPLPTPNIGIYKVQMSFKKSPVHVALGIAMQLHYLLQYYDSEGLCCGYFLQVSFHSTIHYYRYYY